MRTLNDEGEFRFKFLKYEKSEVKNVHSKNRLTGKLENSNTGDATCNSHTLFHS